MVLVGLRSSRIFVGESGPSFASNVVEGRPFPSQPVIHVVDEDGFPVANVTVYAHISIEAGSYVCCAG